MMPPMSGKQASAAATLEGRPVDVDGVVTLPVSTMGGGLSGGGVGLGGIGSGGGIGGGDVEPGDGSSGSAMEKLDIIAPEIVK